MHGGKSLFKPRDVQDAAVDVDAGKTESADLRHAQAVAEHHQEQATVAGLVAAPPGFGILEHPKKYIYFLG